jgi:hypothetical protein
MVKLLEWLAEERMLQEHLNLKLELRALVPLQQGRVLAAQSPLPSPSQASLMKSAGAMAEVRVAVAPSAQVSASPQ